MSTPYDGSSGGHGATATDDPYEGLPPVPSAPAPQTPAEAHDFRPAATNGHHAGANNGGSPDSGLAMLRERMDARPTETPEFTRIIPELGLRLVCSAEIENSTFRRWMKAAQPKRKGRNGQVTDPNDADQLILSGLALAEQNLRIELDYAAGTGREHDWRTLLSDTDGEALTLRSDELKRRYNAMTDLNLLQKLYAPRADPRIIDAGMALVDEAGFAGGIDDGPED